MLNKIKLLLHISDDEQDDVLDTLIEIAGDEAKAYCNVDSIDGIENIIIQMVIYKYNRLGTEGVISESYSGASYTYNDNYPAVIINALNKHRRLKIV